MGVVTVVLERITHLRDTDVIGKTDPYVELHLKQDNLVFDKDYGKQRSSKKANDCNPVFNETFTFCNVPTLDNCVLFVQVWDDDTLGRDDKVGNCKINLEELNISSTPVHVERVIDNKTLRIFSSKARIYMSISYTK